VQHIALTVEDEEALMAAKAHVEGHGIDVIGPIDHTLFKSIYFFDPSGHRLELAANTGAQEVWDKTAALARPILEEWNQTHSVVRQAGFVHAKEFEEA
jgi:catechol-2,3-dioxygenase